MRVALDAMGGDRAPGQIVEGAVAAARDLGIGVLLVGPEDVVRQQLAGRDRDLPIEVLHAPEVIGMDEHPATAVRRKRDSSLLVGLRAVREGRADAFLSAGNSGAVMAGALMVLGRCAGIDRPAITAMIPNGRGRTLLLDAGANADVRPQHLVQFAHMGAIYYAATERVRDPSVGLLSNGEEETKGNALALEAHGLLRASGLNFHGNVEGRDITRGTVHVVVTDGFTGNVALKAMEGASELILGMIREELTSSLRNKLAALALRPAFSRLRARLDPREFGGAPLLGVNGVVLIAHGRSDARAIRNAVRVAGEAAGQDLVSAINRAGSVETTGAQA